MVNNIELCHLVDDQYTRSGDDIEETTTELTFSITKDRSGLLKGGPIDLLEPFEDEDNERVVPTTNPAFCEIQKRLGYGKKPRAFVRALLGTTLINAKNRSKIEQRKDGIHVKTEDLDDLIRYK